MIEAKSVASSATKSTTPHQPGGRAVSGFGGTSSGSSECHPASASTTSSAKIPAIAWWPSSSATKPSAVAAATAIGQGESGGMLSTSSAFPSTTVDAGVSWPSSSTSSPRSSRRRSACRSASSQFGYGLVTCGTTAKLYGGGGDVVAHSSVPPWKGSGPDGAPRRKLHTRFAASTTSPSASRYEPSVSIMFELPQPSPCWYV